MLATKNIVISGTNFWNPGDDFVRDGVIKILHEASAMFKLQFIFIATNCNFLKLYDANKYLCYCKTESLN